MPEFNIHDIANQTITSLLTFGMLIFSYTWGRNIKKITRLSGVLLWLVLIAIGLVFGLIAYISNGLIATNKFASMITILTVYIIGLLKPVKTDIHKRS